LAFFGLLMEKWKKAHNLGLFFCLFVFEKKMLISMPFLYHPMPFYIILCHFIAIFISFLYHFVQFLYHFYTFFPLICVILCHFSNINDGR
jgi:hypothetical protein